MGAEASTCGAKIISSSSKLFGTEVGLVFLNSEHRDTCPKWLVCT